jgi:hypothetical protein
MYGLYVCTCVFLLHQECFEMILVNNPSFYDGGVTEPVDGTDKLCNRINILTDSIINLTTIKIRYVYLWYVSVRRGISRCGGMRELWW